MGLSWMLLAAALLLLPGESGCAVNQNLLATIIDKIWTDYKLNRMFSMAVSIPRQQNKYDIDGVLNQINGAEVVRKIKSGEVYKEGRMVAATFLTKKKAKADDDIHAEYRVLQDFDFLLGNNNNFEDDLLIFYVLGSPCYHKCTNPDHPNAILNYLKDIKRWANYAFVFTHIAVSKNKALETTDKDRETALHNLAFTGGLGLQNIFRCEKKDDNMECSSCSQNNKMAHYCISNEPKSTSDQQGSSRSRNNSPSQSIRGGNNSPSQESPLLNRNRPDVIAGNNQGDSLVRRLCLSCLDCCRRRRPLSDKS